MVTENIYDNYRQTLVRVLGSSNQKEADELFEEIFSSKKANTIQF